MELRKFIATTIREYLKENYSNIHRMKPYLEEIFNVEIIKVLGDDSIGVAYLTKDGNVLKITSSISEFDISNKLLKRPNKHFPIIFKIRKLNNNWYGIYKEFIPFINNKIRRKFLLLEKELNNWFEDYDNNELLIHKLINTKDTLFYDYLSDLHPSLINLYEQLMNIVDYTIDIVNNDAVDIHVDNLGIKNNNIVLFDY